jgi:hypothetical protein
MNTNGLNALFAGHGPNAAARFAAWCRDNPAFAPSPDVVRQSLAYLAALTECADSGRHGMRHDGHVTSKAVALAKRRAEQA